MNAHTTLHGLFNAPLLFIEETTSVLDEAAKLIKEREHSPPLHGTVIMTSYQTQGRGQQGNTWIAKKNTSLLIAILLEKHTLTTQNPTLITPSQITLCMATVLCKSLQKIFSEHNKRFSSLPKVQIKWPNDVLVNNNKIAGILTESYQNWIVIGIGLNLSTSSYSELIENNSFNLSPVAIDSFGGIVVSPQDMYTMIHSQLTQDILNSMQESIAYTNWVLWKKNDIVHLSPSSEVTKQHIPLKVTILQVDTQGALVIRDAKDNIKTMCSAHLLEINTNNIENGRNRKFF